jgi:preprotein translocase subunit SecG
MLRLLALLAACLVTMALLAPLAMADNDHGEGLYGQTNDKVVTNAGFILIAFFPLLILILTLLQTRLDKRKAARLAAKRARAVRQRNGW